MFDKCSLTIDFWIATQKHSAVHIAILLEFVQEQQLQNLCRLKCDPSSLIGCYPLCVPYNQSESWDHTSICTDSYAVVLTWTLARCWWFWLWDFVTCHGCCQIYCWWILEEKLGCLFCHSKFSIAAMLDKLSFVSLPSTWNCWWLLALQFVNCRLDVTQ